MLVLYANPHEVKYVECYEEDMINIGIGAKNLRLYQLDSGIDHIVLFGCSGWRGGRNIKLDRLYEWYKFDGTLVDMESQIVFDMCMKLDIIHKFTSIRYIIDFDRDRVKPFGINHFWRKFQHKRMQKKFNAWLENNKLK